MTALKKGTRPIAFVAMKFDSEHWRDERYKVISDELTKAGYDCSRSDDLSTSGPVVDEVCKLLQEADIVVIDSSKDSHSVSYEIGYCHGIGRGSDKTLLLRDDDKIPFNYRHYRHRLYKNKRELRRHIRDFLDIYESPSDEQLGYSFTFEFPSGADGFITEGAHSIFHALSQKGLTGRCECYSGILFYLPGNHFCVGIMIRLGNSERLSPTYKWWTEVKQLVIANISKRELQIELQEDMSELGTKRAMKDWMLPSGIAEFSDGKITRVLSPDDDCHFVSFSNLHLKD